MRHTLITIFTLLVLIVPFQAIGYNPLVEGDIPHIKNDYSITNLLRVLFAISVGVAAVLAAIMLAIGGFRYMTSESVFKLGDAKEQISNAIIGLLIVLLCVAILKTIHPDIVSMNLFQ